MNIASPEIIERIARKQREASRLTSTLLYYNWLSDKGINYADIRGVADVSAIRQHMHRRGYLLPGENRYSFKMVDGSVQIVKDIPFDADVIFNRSRL